jgi:large conductance mechanosensitive channel
MAQQNVSEGAPHLAKGYQFLHEFKEFAMRGNVVDLTVGVVIGAAFGKIVTAFVSDFITPIIGKLTGGLNLEDKFFSLDPHKTAGITTLNEAKKVGAVIGYGDFITTVVQFIIIAFAIFLMVKGINTLRRRMEAEFRTAKTPPPAEPTREEKLLMEIRDLLKARC